MAVSYFFIDVARFVMYVCFFLTMWSQCSDLFLPTFLWQEKMQPHPSPERVEKVADSESMAEATSKMGVFKQWTARKLWDPKRNTWWSGLFLVFFGRFWKKPANVGVHPFQSIWDSISPLGLMKSFPTLQVFNMFSCYINWFSDILSIKK